MATMLSTVDNPFNPFEQFDEWQAFDESKGYYTCELLARLSSATPFLSLIETDRDIDRLIDDVLRLNPLGIHIKVRSTDFKDVEKK